MAYPTPEGEVLGSIIWNNMVDNFGSGKFDYLYDDCFIKCFSSSDEEKLNTRVENLKAYVAIREGVVQYVDGYSMVDTITEGSMVGQVSKKTVNIQTTDNVHLTGYLNLYDRFGMSDKEKIDNVYSFYSIPNIFGTNNTEDYIAGAEELFEVIISWLSFPFVNVDVYGTGKGVNIKGSGTVRFGKNDDKPNKQDNINAILEEIRVQMPALNEKLKTNLTDNGETQETIYAEFWNIIASGVAEYMNINSVTTTDIGVGTINYMVAGVPSPTPDIAVYSGVSEGSAKFGSQLITHMNIGLEVPQIQYKIPFELNIPPICFTLNIKDENGVKKETNVCLAIGEISTNIADAISKVVEVITNAITVALQKIAKILNGVGESIEKINQTLQEAFEKFLAGAKTVIEAIFAKFTEFITKIMEIVIIPAVEAVRTALWSVFLNAQIPVVKAALTAYFETIKVIEFIKQKITSLAIFAKIAGVISDINDGIAEINESITKKITDINNTLTEAVSTESSNSDCSCLIDIISLIASIPIPTIPSLPSLDFTNDSTAKCPTGNIDADGNNICETCNEDNMNNLETYGPCPVIDDDGNLVELPLDNIPPFPFKEVSTTDTDYDAVKDAIVPIPVPDVPDLDALIPLPKIDLFKTVILDNGHGGIINGVYQTEGKRSPVWDDGLQIFEGVFNRQVVNGIKEQLATSGIPYYEVANTNDDRSLDERVFSANDEYNANNSVYVSVHSNAAPSIDARGFEAYSYDWDTKKASPYFVDYFYYQFAVEFPTARLRIGDHHDFVGKIANFTVLKKTKMPAILTENFFMTNEYECREYLKEGTEGQQKIIDFHIRAIDKIARYR